MRRVVIGLGVVASSGLFVGSAAGLLPLDPIEVLGFVTGAASVWLTVEERIWNFPVGILNSAFYVAVFLQARLFAGTSLQVVFIALGFLGWYAWLRGGRGRAALHVARVGIPEALALGIALVAGTWGLTALLISVGDASPFLDALTAALGLVAQYLLNRKAIENWLVWIATDAISIGLYLSRGLSLTALLYVISLTMCVAGLVQWRRTLEPAGAGRRS